MPPTWNRLAPPLIEALSRSGIPFQNIDDDVLTISGERKVEKHETKEKGYCRIERAYGSFKRSVYLGSSVDKDNIKANYKNGVLEITLPKTETAKSKRIDVDVE